MNAKAKNFLLFIILFAANTGFAQGDTIFFDDDWKVCTKTEAKFFRIAERQGDLLLLKDMFLKNNQPQMVAACETLTPLVKNGKCTYYYENGIKSSEGNYINNKMEGIWINWDEDGKDSSITQCNADGTHKYIRIAKKQTVDGKYNVNYPDEVMPEYQGGEAKRVKFLQKHIKFPEAERKAKISGVCYVSFIVEADGSISNVKILKGVTNGPGYDAEAIRVVQLMPKWKPGRQNGKAVRVQFNMPIRFTP